MTDGNSCVRLLKLGMILREHMMSQVLQIRTKVLPGNRIEVSTPDLTVGQEVDVVVSQSLARPRQSILEFVEALPAGRLFKTPEEADEYLKRERDSWER
jgi:hypothetical protein